ncbi:MAG: GMC family oxidoreductase [Acidimicrobiia bacterium]|nr:GMC family oxidoreductase [Acidimicrobiia bacterium]MCL4291756.1 GMC family oxidoreductase [Acidimicrobiia bacterium]
MTDLRADVVVVGSGAGGAVTAATLAEGGRDVCVVEEGPWIAPDELEPFSFEEMRARYRHRGLTAALGRPGIAYAEGRCVGGSTEINSGLYRRLPEELAARWQERGRILEFTPDILDHYASTIEEEIEISTVPGAPPLSSALIERGATKLGWRSTEFARLFSYSPDGRGTKQTMARTFVPRAVAAGARIVPDTEAVRVLVDGGRATGVACRRRRPDGAWERFEVRAPQVFVCGGAIQSPALLQRSGIRGLVGSGLEFHPTIKVAARFPHPIDHDDVPMHRVTEFPSNLTIGGSASTRGHVALAIADAAPGDDEALDAWESTAVYYTAIKSEGHGRVWTLPGLHAPVVAYSLTEADLSLLARGLVHLGELLFAAGATALYPSIAGGPVLRRRGDLVSWWDAVDRNRVNLMTVHLASTIRMGEDQALAAADSFGRIRGVANLWVNDASLLPTAPGVNPQAAIMAIARRNADHFLANT